MDADDLAMGVFFFGMGYSSLATARAIHQIIDGDVPIFGTSRTEEGIEALRKAKAAEYAPPLSEIPYFGASRGKIVTP